MRTASAEYEEALAQETTTLALLWKVTRADGTILRFTDAVRPVEISGDGTYRADISFTSSAIFTSRTLSRGQNVTISVVMDDLGLRESDLRNRLYDNAVGEVSQVDYENPDFGVLKLFTGTFGTIKITDKKRATIEIQPTSGAVGAGRTIGGEKYSQTSRASLGDARCGVDIEALKVAFTVDSASGGSFVASELTQDAGHWAFGYVKWLTGANAGRINTVQNSDQDTTSAFLSATPFNPIEIGDTGEIFPGCDKLVTTCRDKFDNVNNMRAEPFVPTGEGTGLTSTNVLPYG